MNESANIKFIATAFGLATSLLGAFFLVCWHLGYYKMLALPPAEWEITYPVSLSIFFAGIGILSTLFKPRWHLINALGILITLFFGIRLAEITFVLEMNVTAFVTHLVQANPPLFHETSPAATFNLLVLGLIMVFWSVRKRSIFYNNALIFASLLITFIGIVGVVACLLPNKQTFGWYGIAPVHFYGSLCVVFAGLGLIFTRFYYENMSGTTLLRWFPFIITLACFAFTILLTIEIKKERENVIRTGIHVKAESLKSQIMNYYTNQTNSFSRMVGRVNNQTDHPNKAWRFDAQRFMQDQSDLKSIIWTDDMLSIQSTLPRRLHKQNVTLPVSEVLNIPTNLLDSALMKSKPSAFLSNDGILLHIAYPLGTTQTHHGLLIFTMDVPMLITSAINEMPERDFKILISHNDSTVLELNPEVQTLDIKQLSITQPLSFNDVTLTMSLSPTRELLGKYLSNLVIYMTLIGGFLVSSFLGMLIHLWQLSQSRINTVENSQRQLETLKDDLLYTLNSAQIATWDYNFESNRILWNDVTYRLFNFKPDDPITYETFLSRIHPEDKEMVQSTFDLSLQKGLPFSSTYRVVWPDNSVHYITSRGRTYFDNQGKATRMTGICWDVSEVKRNQLLLQLSDKIIRILSEAQTPAEVAVKIRHVLYRAFGWEVMILWLINKKNKHLDCIEISTFHELPIPEFEQYTRTHPLSTDETVPGQVISTHRPVWFKDFSKGVLSERSAAAGRAGLKGYFALPIFNRSRIIGMVELLRRPQFIEEVDEALLNMMASLGIYLGQFFHRAEAQEMQNLLTSIVTHASNGIHLCRIDGTIQVWNEGSEKIYGWLASEIIGKSIRIIYPPNHEEEFRDLFHRLKHGEIIENFETQRLTRDGRLIWVMNSYAPIHNDAGEVDSVSVIVQDITKQKSTTEALIKSEEKFRAFVETTEEWIWEIDSNYRVTYSNPSIQKILGFSPEEVIGKELFIFIPEKYRNRVKSAIDDSIKSKSGWTQNLYTAQDIKGAYHYLESNSAPILDKNNKVVGFRGADRDVTERKNIEKSKSEFISIVSHELRTPLTSIHGALGLLAVMKDLPQKAKELAEIAFRNSERLSRIIKDILDIEKQKLNRFEFNVRQVRLAEVVKESIVAFVPMAEKAHIQLLEDLPLPETLVEADPERLIQVMGNLLSNAIKFSRPNGKVFVGIENHDTSARVYVRDEGLGIPKDFYSKVFERFAQANSSDSREFGGAGLGLHVCKNIIEQHGGTIGFSSIEGKGTTFYFDLPVLQKR